MTPSHRGEPTVDDAPLILTLRFDADSFERFDDSRREHFPTDRNFIPAHLTLFHHLPGDQLAEVSAAIASRAEHQSSFPVAITGLRFLGQGTAYVVESPELMQVRGDLASLWSVDLTRQDAQGFRPHITIQNKVAAKKARKLFEGLSTSFQRFEAEATGLLLWRYRGGPWEAAGEFSFSA